MKSHYLLILLSTLPMLVFGQSKIDKVSITTLHEIGNSDDYLIGSIDAYQTDTFNNVYILDGAQQSILKFNSTGRYLTTIGRRGRGPGEFLDLRNIFVLNNQLYALDPIQFRISKFNTEGVLLDSYLTPKKSQVLNFFRFILPNDDHTFLIYYRQWGYGRYAHFDKDEIFHLWSKNFDEELQSFGSFDEFGYSNQFARRFIETKSPSILKYRNQILVVPNIYEGQIFNYTPNSNGWELKGKISGRTFGKPSYTSLNEKNNDLDTYSISSLGNRVYGKVDILSAGLFTFQEKYIVHFTLVKNQDEQHQLYWELGVEIFDKHLNYLSYHPLENYALQDISISRSLIGNKDVGDRFYMSFRNDDEDILRVFELHINTK